MSIIRATRRGFLYQDRVAVSIYLDELQKGNIKEYYNDFPHLSRKSLDIKHVDANNCEIIYEVKSGEEFKKDKKSKDSSEIRDAFLNFKEYLDSNSDSKLYLIIRKPFKNEISNYWNNMEIIHRYSFNHPTIKIALDYLYKKLNLPDIGSNEELFGFCRKINMSEYENDELNHNNDRFCDIDDKVINSIDDLADLFDAHESFYEHPSETLMRSLYFMANSHAGSGLDLHPIFLKMIENFFASRKFLNHCEPPAASHHKTRENVRDKIQKKINELSKKIIFVENKITTVAYGSEGEAYEY